MWLKATLCEPHFITISGTKTLKGEASSDPPRVETQGEAEDDHYEGGPSGLGLKKHEEADLICWHQRKEED